MRTASTALDITTSTLVIVPCCGRNQDRVREGLSRYGAVELGEAGEFPSGMCGLAIGHSLARGR
jgi:hypothetical protein